MYVHKACRPSETELDLSKKAGGFCAACGTEGTVYHVKGQPDYYEHILNSILYKVQDGKSWTAMTAIWAREKEQLAKVKAARRGLNWTGPATDHEEVAADPRIEANNKVVEAELAEETEAIKEVAEEALEEILEEIKEEDIPPEEPELEAEPEPSEKDAKIAALRAELAALEPED